MKKKIIAVLLSACMLVSACPTGAFAMSDEETNTYTATGDVMQGGAPVVDETELMDDLADRALDNAEVAASKDARVSRFEAATEKIRAEAEHVFDHRKDDDDGRVAGKDD